MMVDIDRCLENGARPASPEMVEAALSVPMWNHCHFVDAWQSAGDEEIALMLGQLFQAMLSAKAA